MELQQIQQFQCLILHKQAFLSPENLKTIHENERVRDNLADLGQQQNPSQILLSSQLGDLIEE